MAPFSINSRSSSSNNDDSWWDYEGAVPPLQSLETQENDTDTLSTTLSGMNVEDVGLHRIIIGVDFGTTYTGKLISVTCIPCVSPPY